jgi:TonB family protein
MLRIRINDMGWPVGAQVEKSSGTRSLDASAVDIAKSWRFDPRACMLPGSGRTMDLAVPVSFTLPAKRAPNSQGAAEPHLSWGELH